MEEDRTLEAKEPGQEPSVQGSRGSPDTTQSEVCVLVAEHSPKALGPMHRNK